MTIRKLSAWNVLPSLVRRGATRCDWSDSRLIPTVFLPGLLCDATIWRETIDRLADIVAPVVADLTLDNSIAGMAQRVIAAAPSRFALVAVQWAATWRSKSCGRQENA